MSANEKARQLYWIATNNVADYFYRLGGSGRYFSFQEWHPFAYVAITAMRVDLGNEEDIAEKIFNHPSYSLERIFDVKEFKGSIQPTIEDLHCSEMDIGRFLYEANKLLVERICKLSNKNKLSPSDLDELMSWGVFKAEMYNFILPRMRTTE